MKKITVILAFVMTFVSNCFGQLSENFDNFSDGDLYNINGSDCIIDSTTNWGCDSATNNTSLAKLKPNNFININIDNNYIKNIKLNCSSPMAVIQLHLIFKDISNTTILDSVISITNSCTYNIFISNSSINNTLIKTLEFKNNNSNLTNILYIDNININVDSSTSLSKPKEITSLVYPNPTRDLITIKMDSYDTYNVKLVDPLGRVIQVSEFKGTESVIDISSQIDGFYLLQITDSKGQVSNKKVQLQK